MNHNFVGYNPNIYKPKTEPYYISKKLPLTPRNRIKKAKAISVTRRGSP
jgi:hypothetical protein